MVAVGLLAAMLNASLQFTVLVAERVVEIILKGFAISRLRTKRTAPIIHDNDAWLLNVPFSIWKYCRHPGMCNILPLACLECHVYD